MDSNEIKQLLENISLIGLELVKDVYGDSSLSEREKLIKLKECSIRILTELSKISHNKSKLQQLCMNELNNLIESYDDIITMKKEASSYTKIDNLEILTNKQILSLAELIDVTDTNQKLNHGILITLDSLIISCRTKMPNSVIEIIKSLCISDKVSKLTKGFAIRCLVREPEYAIPYNDELTPIVLKYLEDPEFTFFGVYYFTSFSIGHSYLIPMDVLISLSKLIIPREKSLVAYNAIVSIYNCFIHETHITDELLNTCLDILEQVKEKEILHYTFGVIETYILKKGELDETATERILAVLKKETFEFTEMSIRVVGRLILLLNIDEDILARAEKFLLTGVISDPKTTLFVLNESVKKGFKLTNESIELICDMAVNKANPEVELAALNALIDLTDNFCLLDLSITAKLESLLYDSNEDIRNAVQKIIAQNTDNKTVMDLSIPVTNK
jgi:hypothetical protein